MRLRHLALCLLLAAPVAYAGVPKSELDEHGRGIIDNYEDLKEGGALEWLWVAPGTKLSQYRYEFKAFENLTTLADDDMEKVVSEGLPKVLARVGAKDNAAPKLTVDAAVYWAQRANSAKMWIPYAGGHLAQAGVGLEVVLKDPAGKVVAKVRHSGREGHQLEAAAQELVDEIANFVRAN